jgi:hypothetical protein
MNELGMDVTQEPKTRKLPVNANKTVTLPVDFLQWIKVGVLNEKGEVATLHHNSNMTSYGILEDDRTQINTGTIVNNDDLQGYRNYRYQDTYYNLYGIPAGTRKVGEFKVNDTEGFILLDNEFPETHVILEYLSSPAADEEYLIPIQVYECLIAWLGWKDVEMLPQSRRSNLSVIATRRKEFLRLKGLAKRRLNPLRLHEANDVIRLTNRISIRS